MIRAQNDRCAFTGEIHQGPEHQVMEAVGAFDDVFVQVEIRLGDLWQPWWVVFHEAVTKMVDGVVVDGCEIPWFECHCGCRYGVNAGALRQDLGDTEQAFVLVLIDRRSLGNERQQLFRIDFPGVNAELR